MEKKEKTISIIYVVVLSVILIFLLMLDIAVSFVYIPYWSYYIVSVLILLPLLLIKYNHLKMILFIVYTLIIFILLPKIRWNELKEFYIDAEKIEIGFTEKQVDTIMKNYLKNPKIIEKMGEEEVDLSKSRIICVKETKEEHKKRILYTPKNHKVDWFIIYLEDGVVARKVISPD